MSGTPATRISRTKGYANVPPAATPPMSISQPQLVPPPPLPPPRYIDIAPGLDPGWQFGNHDINFGQAASVKPGSSLLGGAMPKGPRNEQENDLSGMLIDPPRRPSSTSTVTTTTRDQDMTDDGTLHSNSDEDSTLSRQQSNHRLHSERQLEQRTLEESSNSYDKHLLSRIGGPNGPNTPKRQSISFAPGSVQETAQLAQAESERRSSGQLRPLSLPERHHQQQQVALDPPTISSRWPQPQSGATSPGVIGSWHEHGPSDTGRKQTRHGSLTFDDSISHHGGYDHTAFAHEDFIIDDGHMHSLHLHDRSPGSEDVAAAKTGSKRRASSPPRDGSREDGSSVSGAATHSDSYPRRSMQQFSTRDSPVSRFHTNPSSLSPASSYAPRHGSLGSSLGVSSIPSSATSYGSGRLSPSACSPAFDPEFRIGVPHGNAASKTVILGPAAPNPHHRTLSESTQASTTRGTSEGVTHSRTGSMSRSHGGYMCECCPKKPKKYESEEELRAHESEKQYTCAYCPNRFKNKNEAERHQNSLHLRRHSWSCAALAGAEAAFHTSPAGNGTDTCGYCGEEFSNPPQWDVRAEHLNHIHKFGDCNQVKKFFRADHFRQHLKHSHAGTSGKWTNMLENACMKDEPLPEKRVSQGLVPPRSGGTSGVGGPGAPPLMVSTSMLAMAGAPPGGGGVIEETPLDN